MSNDIENEGVDASQGEDGNSLPLANWVTLSKFVVQVQKRTNVVAPLYGNGLQQVPIEIVIEARDANGAVVSLTDKQLKDIEIIRYEDSSVVETGVYFKWFVYDFDVSREDDGRSDIPPVEGDGPGATAQTTMRYWSTGSVATYWFAAQIKSPAGVVYRTNTPNPTPGKFDSWVKVRAMEAPVYGHEKLTWKRYNAVTEKGWDIDVYYISFANSDGRRMVDAVNRTVMPDMAHLSRKGWGDSANYYYAHIMYKFGERRSVSTPMNSGMPVVSFYVNEYAECVTVARLRSVAHQPYPDRGTGANLICLDQYGNSTKCHVLPVDGHNMIELVPYKQE